MKRLAVLFTSWLHFATVADGFEVTIRVCQNKDCCQRFEGRSMNLVETLADLLPPSMQVRVETTGCLSRCDKGPNICVERPNEQDIFIHGIRDAAIAAAELELSASLATHPTLLAAVNVMEKTRKTKTSTEKLKLVNSVIKKLSSTDGLTQSAAIAHAHCFRAQVHLDAHHYILAKEDAQIATEIHLNDDHILLPSSAWRILADAEEATGNYDKAVEALRKWADCNPKFSTKVAKEINRLRRMMV